MDKHLAVMSYINDDDRLVMFAKPVNTLDQHLVETYMLREANIDVSYEFEIMIISNDPPVVRG